MRSILTLRKSTNIRIKEVVQVDCGARVHACGVHTRVNEFCVGTIACHGMHECVRHSRVSVSH